MVPPVTALGEERFRALLDEHGLLRADALAAPARRSCFTVFAQREDAALDVAALRTHAERFFDAKLGLTVEKRYGEPPPPSVDAARIVVATADPTTSGTRLCYARPTDPDDLAAAEAAEAAQATYGMAALARRCRTVWLVERVPEHDGDDRVALLVAAVLASALLGPILAPRGDELFGVRTARTKLG